MTDPVTPKQASFRAITQARLTHGVRGQALDTASTLAFALDHARAREAVMSELDAADMAKTFEALDLPNQSVRSAATTRDMFVQRPDLGRQLPTDQNQGLKGIGPVDVALVLGDGLSAIAASLNGPAFMATLSGAISSLGWTASPVILAHNARVALGDKIAQAIGAQTVVMALGERPGLSAADSLGVYITHRPQCDTADSARNCISNIREDGLAVGAAAQQALALIEAMRATNKSGVALSEVLALDAAKAPGIAPLSSQTKA
ncbi:ethanolamine ammonia-lyase subunit EutC [Algirhabdus cladophorae]|uniref:ethanolamine ammonia-lyase subunit EutC n=1 Tax=Algirhabdus cladophorae TaxID=3377108 RepID=UPI003B84A520